MILINISLKRCITFAQGFRKIVYSLQMPLWFLASMKYANNFNPVACNAVIQYVTLYGQASDVRQKLRTLNAHEWLLS